MSRFRTRASTSPIRARSWAWALLLGAVLLSTGCVTLAPPHGGSVGEAPSCEVITEGAAIQGPATCGGVALPPGWPDFSGDREALLAPFLTCASPAEFMGWRRWTTGAPCDSVPRARPLMSKARPEATSTGSPRKAGAAEHRGTLASLVDKEVGHTLEVVEAKLAAVELESTGPRLPTEVGVLEKHRPSLDAPPPEAQGNPRWGEYVHYYEKRLGEVKKGEAAEGPLSWEGYERMRGGFARGMAFERDMVKLLKEDAKKEGRMKDQMREDAREALRKYGETVDIRRDSLQSLFPGGTVVQVPRVRLIYEGGPLKPKRVEVLKRVMGATRAAVPGVEVLFQ